MEKQCPFCIENNLLRVKVLYEDDLWYITNMEEGNINNAAMAIPKRHIATPFEISENEWAALQQIISKMKDIVDDKEQPHGYNLGWNVGEVGGQHVHHVHLHLLARYADEPLAGKGIRYAFKQVDNRRQGPTPRKTQLLSWCVYEITSAKSSLNGVMLRGRIRKLGIENNFNVLAENTGDVENGVRFAVIDKSNADVVIKYLKSIIEDVKVELLLEDLTNPVLSKIKVNDESRYEL